MHWRRARFHRRYPDPCARPDAEGRTRMGMADAAQSAPARTALRALPGRHSRTGSTHHSTNCQRTDEESGMTSTLTLALRARNASHAQQKYQICLIHPFDPRGEKVGGLETYIRDFITFHPADTDLLFIGVDSTGDLALGEVHTLTFRCKNCDWPPILDYSLEQAREAARSNHK